MSDKKIVVLNRGTQTYKLRPGLDGSVRVLEPGTSIETLDAKEAAELLDYFNIVDAAKVMPKVAEESDKLRARIQELTEENTELRKQAGAVVPPVPERKPAARHKKG